MNKMPQDVEEYLAKIRKTVSEAQEVMDEAQLRIQETDRFLESQGLTREQVLKFNVTREQKLAVNEELRRRGLPPIEDDDSAFDFNAATEELRRDADFPMETNLHSSGNEEFTERQRRFGNLMHEFRI